MLGTVPQIRPSFNCSLRIGDPFRMAQSGHWSLGATGDPGTDRHHRLVDRAFARSAAPPVDPLLPGKAAADSIPAAGAGLARPVRRRPPAPGPELAGGEPDPSGSGGSGGGPRSGLATDPVPAAGHPQPGGEPSGPARGGDGDGLPADRDSGGWAAEKWEKAKAETEPVDGPGRGRSPGGGPWTAAGKPMERVLQQANGAGTTARKCRSGSPYQLVS